MSPHGQYWVCPKCKRWEWNSKLECFRCHLAAPHWVVRSKRQQHDAATTASGGPAADSAGFVQQPRSRRAQRRAARMARESQSRDAPDKPSERKPPLEQEHAPVPESDDVEFEDVANASKDELLAK
eukprot:2220438-Amphidinium_carterae.1